MFADCYGGTKHLEVAKPDIRGLVLWQPLCGTNPPFAAAAIARAEGLRSCGTPILAMQHNSPKQSFTKNNFAEFQTAFFAAT